MNRRTFLKSIAIACGATVVCPNELLKSPVAGIDCSKPIMWCGIGERSKHIVMADFGEQRWPKYYAECHKEHIEQIVKQMEKAFWNTKFKSPLIRLL